MDEKQALQNYLYEIIGTDGCCGGVCRGDEIFKDNEGWKLFMEGFMEPWPLGKNVAEAKAALQEYADMGFGQS